MSKSIARHAAMAILAVTFLVLGSCAAIVVPDLIPAETPVLAPDPGDYAVAQSVTMTSATEGARIRYTLDGSTPTSDYGAEYTGVAIRIASTTVLRAVAYAEDRLNSEVAEATYTIEGIAAETPVLAPAPGSYTVAQSVTLSSATSGGIRYTLDGSTPTSTYGAEYTGIPIDVVSTTLLKVVAYAEGYLDSYLAGGVYTIDGTVATPTMSPGGGAYSASQLVSMETVTAPATIHYTTDGTIPSSTYGAVYTGIPIAVDRSLTIKAVAFSQIAGSSMVVSTTYTINGRVAMPVISPAAGTYALPQTVAITTATPGAMIHYTTDGSTPTATDGTPYGGAFLVSGSVTLRAVAYLVDWTDSAVAVASYVIPGKVTTPVAIPSAGTYPTEQLVSISSTDGATIRYTLDGTYPSAAYGTVYTVPVSVPNNMTLRAIAYNGLWLDSNVLTSDYEIALDSGGDVGQFTSLAMDADTMFVVYYDASTSSLKRAFSVDDGATWPVAAIDSIGSVGQYASVAMAGTTVYTSYYDSAALDLRFARSTNGGVTWSRSLLDSTGDVGRYTSVAVDDLTPAIVAVSYYDLTNKNLKVARSIDSGVTWTVFPIVDTQPDVGEFTTIAAAGGNLYVGYYDATITELDLRFVKYNGSSWLAPVTVDGPAAAKGKYASIAVGPEASTIRIAYYDATNGDLRMATSTDDGLTWPTLETVDSQGNRGLHTSIATASGGKVYIAYFEDLNYNLKLATYDGVSAWTKQTVDANGVGENTSIEVLGSTIAISYYDIVNQNLKLARSTDDGLTWSFY